MQIPQWQPTLADKWVMLPQHHLNWSSPSTARNYWTSFEKYVAFETRQGKINTCVELKNMSAWTLTDNVWSWFEPIMNNILDMANLKENLIKGFNTSEQSL